MSAETFEQEAFDERDPFMPEKAAQSSDTLQRLERRQPTVLYALWFLGVLIYTSLVAGVAINVRAMPVSECIKRTSAWSPAIDAVEINTVKFDAAFNEPSPFKGSGPEVDAAWDRITRIDGFYLHEHALTERLHKPTTAVKTEHGYLVWLEVFHQLHCLNLLRKWTHAEDYNGTGDVDLSGSPDIQRSHIDHCVDLLRLVLMCQADTTLLTFHWVKGIATPSPDFENYHTCRNFDRISDWAKVKSAEVGHIDIKKPPNAFELDKVP